MRRLLRPAARASLKCVLVDRCGVPLGFAIIYGMAELSRRSSAMLLQAAHSAQCTSFEALGLHCYGSRGKLSVELALVGLQLGTLVAFFDVIGDVVSRSIVWSTASESVGAAALASSIRPGVMLAFCLLVALPLCLLPRYGCARRPPLSGAPRRHWQWLTRSARRPRRRRCCVARAEMGASLQYSSLVFYCVALIAIALRAVMNVAASSVWRELRWFRPVGLLHVTPILIWAFSSQSILFAVWQSLGSPSVPAMERVFNRAIELSTWFFSLVRARWSRWCAARARAVAVLTVPARQIGISGYVAFVGHDAVIAGDMINMFPLQSRLFSLLRLGASPHAVCAGPRVAPERAHCSDHTLTL